MEVRAAGTTSSMLADFEATVVEINVYFRFLLCVEDPAVRLVKPSQSSRGRRIEPESLKILKASAFLVLYNLVESTTRQAFAELYERMRQDGCTASDVRAELRRLWIEQNFRSLDSHSASLRNYQEKATQLLQQVFQSEIILLDSAKLPIAGNLDGSIIRKICQQHGVKFRPHYRAQGGSELETVRKHRNALGHGDVSFAECGRQYTVIDLIRIKNQVVVFSRSLLKSIQSFIKSRDYVA